MVSLSHLLSCYVVHFMHCRLFRLAGNVLQLGEVANLEAQMFNLAQMFI